MLQQVHLMPICSLEILRLIRGFQGAYVQDLCYSFLQEMIFYGTECLLWAFMASSRLLFRDIPVLSHLFGLVRLFYVCTFLKIILSGPAGNLRTLLTSLVIMKSRRQSSKDLHCVFPTTRIMERRYLEVPRSSRQQVTCMGCGIITSSLITVSSLGKQRLPTRMDQL